MVAELGGVGLAQDDETRPSVTANQLGVLARDMAEECPRALGLAGPAEGRPEVLEEEWNTRERPVRQRFRGFSAGSIEEPGDHRVQGGVDRLDPGDGRLDELDGRDLLATDEPGLVEGVEPGERGDVGPRETAHGPPPSSAASSWTA